MAEKLTVDAIAGLIGWRTAHLASTGSTNADLIEAAESGEDVDMLWLTAGEQLRGRGRRGRKWVSPPGNLYASCYLKAPAIEREMSFLPLVLAVAVHRAMNAALEGAQDIEIKWPNDILINGAKCCGLLIEAHRLNGQFNAVIGCGINIVAHPENTPYPAIHLNALKPDLDSTAVFHHLTGAFAEALDEWDQGRGKASIRDYWLEHARGLGQSITVNLAASSIEGIFDGIDADGQLLLTRSDGTTHEISAGDVFFPRNAK